MKSLRAQSLVVGLLCCASCLAGATTVLAWGPEGHRVVARIATRNLSPGSRAKVAAILGTDAAGLEAAMATAATWPDDIKNQEQSTRPWHFVDVPIASPFSPAAVAAVCSNHDCVVDRIAEMRDRLAQNQTGFALPTPPTPARSMTSQELAFLIHFVGDVHQPLHASNNGDRGGNCVNLIQPIPHNAHGRSRPTTEVHAAWDDDEVLAVFGVLGSEDATVAALVQKSRTGPPVQQLTPVDWAHESNDMAKADVYQRLHIPNRTAPAGQCAPNITPVNVDLPYLNGNVADVEQRLMLAGIRLANVLNAICAGSGCAATPAGPHRSPTI